MKKYPPRASANSTTTATIQVRRDTWRSSDGVSLVVFGGGTMQQLVDAGDLDGEKKNKNRKKEKVMTLFA